MAIRKATKTSDKQPNLVGAAGEYFVMSQLLRRGYIAALAPVGVPNADIVVTDKLGDRLCAVQVKSRSGKNKRGGWMMGKKHEDIKSTTLFYCFVDFGGDNDEKADCWIVPSSVVAKTIAKSHLAWLKQPGKKGQQRTEGKMRKFNQEHELLGKSYKQGWLEEYRETWDVLKVRSRRAP